MGSPKENLTLGGETFLDRVIGAASEAFDEVVVVSRGVTSPGRRLILEPPHEQTAPIFGIREALRDALARNEEKVWVIAVDYPAMTAHPLRFLRARFESSDAQLLAPRSDGKLHWLCAGYSTALLERVEERIASGDYALHGLSEASRTMIVTEIDPKALRNVNTPADFETVKGEYEQALASR